MGAPKPVVQASEPEPVQQVIQVQKAQDNFQPSKAADAALKFSDLKGTNLSQPIGTPTMANSIAPSESSQTSMAMSVCQDTDAMRDHMQEAPAEVASAAPPSMSAEGPTDPVFLMTKMHEMMQKLVLDVNALKAENNELRALLG